MTHKIAAAMKDVLEDQGMTQGFASFFSKGKPINQSSLVLLSYHSRYIATQHVRKLFQREFLNQMNIISLGAGFDSQFFEMKSVKEEPRYYVEIDLFEVICEKANVIQENEFFNQLWRDGNQEFNGFEVDVKEDESFRMLKAPGYLLISGDLRENESLERIRKLLSIENGFDFNLPTLIICECVITYLSPIHSDGVIKWISDNFQNSTFFLYEQVNPFDSYGKSLVNYFNSQKYPLLSISTYPTLNSQVQRFQSLNYQKVEALHLFQSNKSLISLEEKERLKKKLNFFDEHEEFYLASSHYFILCASKSLSLNFFNTNQVSTSTFQFPSLQIILSFESITCSKSWWRYGHSSEVFEDAIYSFCGTNTSRLNETIKFSMIKNEFEKVQTNGNIPSKRLYHSSILIDTKVFLFGGRSNPSNGFNDAYYFDLTTLTWILIVPNSIPPPSRWRHTLSKVGNKLYLFGGKSNSIVFNDWYSFDPESIEWKKIEFLNIMSTPQTDLVPRFSHSSLVVNNLIIIHGGMDSNGNILNLTQVFDVNKEIYWEVKQFQDIPPPRFSHKTFYLGDQWILLIGGIIENDIEQQHQIACLNFISGDYFPLKLDPVDINSTFLINHTLSYVKGEDKLIIFGGGGNTFLAGHQFNQDVLVIKNISQLVSQISSLNVSI